MSRRKSPRIEAIGSNDEETEVVSRNKKKKGLLFVPELESINESKNENDIKEETNQLVEEEKNQVIDEKKNEEINENNVWKKNRKTRRQFFCNSFPTLVITPVNGRLLTSPHPF